MSDMLQLVAQMSDMLQLVANILNHVHPVILSASVVSNDKLKHIGHLGDKLKHSG